MKINLQTLIEAIAAMELAHSALAGGDFAAKLKASAALVKALSKLSAEGFMTTPLEVEPCEGFMAASPEIEP